MHAIVEEVCQIPAGFEAERRILQDADVRGIPVKLANGELFWVPAMRLNARQGVILGLVDSLEGLNARLAACDRRVAVRAASLDDAADEAIDAAGAALELALGARRKAEDAIAERRAEIAYHALRLAYEVSRPETDSLVTSAHWEDLFLALNGQDTRDAEERRAIQFLARLKQAQGEEDGTPSVPFAQSTFTGGAAPS